MYKHKKVPLNIAIASQLLYYKLILNQLITEREKMKQDFSLQPVRWPFTI